MTFVFQMISDFTYILSGLYLSLKLWSLSGQLQDMINSLKLNNVTQSNNKGSLIFATALCFLHYLFGIFYFVSDSHSWDLIDNFNETLELIFSTLHINCYNFVASISIIGPTLRFLWLANICHIAVYLTSLEYALFITAFAGRSIKEEFRMQVRSSAFFSPEQVNARERIHS